MVGGVIGYLVAREVTRRDADDDRAPGVRAAMARHPSNRIALQGRRIAERAGARSTQAIAGASPGGFGTVLSQNAWLPVFRTLGADLWSGGRLLVSRAGTVFDATGEITDAALRENLQKFVAGFVAYVSTRRAR